MNLATQVFSPLNTWVAKQFDCRSVRIPNPQPPIPNRHATNPQASCRAPGLLTAFGCECIILDTFEGIFTRYLMRKAVYSLPSCGARRAERECEVRTH